MTARRHGVRLAGRPVRYEEPVQAASVTGSRNNGRPVRLYERPAGPAEETAGYPGRGYSHQVTAPPSAADLLLLMSVACWEELCGFGFCRGCACPCHDGNGRP